jgi:hypothetical protein
MSIKIKNWHEFQHFKDRCPPWIKLHRSILEQRDISVISDCSFRVLVMLWLLASEDKDKSGTLPSIDDISFRTRIPKYIIIKSLEELKPFLILDDITVISERYQSDAPETETETEKKREKETDILSNDPVSGCKLVLAGVSTTKPKAKKSSKQDRVQENSALMNRIGSWFGRKPNTLWSLADAEKLQSINPSEEDLTAMENYYTAVIPENKDFRRRKLETLLNNWQGELDNISRNKMTSPACELRNQSTPAKTPFQEQKQAGYSYDPERKYNF